MRKESLDLLKTVCAAGHARAAIESEAHAGLVELRKAGLLEVEHALGANQKHLTPLYRPTKAGRVLWLSSVNMRPDGSRLHKRVKVA